MQQGLPGLAKGEAVTSRWAGPLRWAEAPEKPGGLEGPGRRLRWAAAEQGHQGHLGSGKDLGESKAQVCEGPQSCDEGTEGGEQDPGRGRPGAEVGPALLEGGREPA